MKNAILKLTLFLGFILIASGLIASDTKKPPVIDEAQQNKPKEDTIKGGDKIKDISNDKNISLANIKSVYTIKRKGLNFPPYKCYVYHADKSSTQIGTIDKSVISFTIKKSQLAVGDTIIVENSEDTGDNKFPKFIIEWVEVK